MNYEAWRITYQSSEQAARAAFDMAVEARAELDALRNQDQVAIKLGSYGAAFDGPCTKRAYTYEHQPGNVVALKLGRAAAQASFERGGDFIDFGLSLLRALAEEGFGVFDAGAEFSASVPPAPSVPDVWQLVPKAPTPEMVRAGASAARAYMQEHGGNSPHVMWSAMLAAAPQPERVTSNSIGVEAVCVVVDDLDGKRIDWLIEGGLNDLPEGATLIFAHQAITGADGWGEVFLAAPQPERSAYRSQALDDVLAERRRQIDVKGWTPEHDDEHKEGEMAVAAGYYALQCGYPHDREISVPTYWPWDAKWWKPRDKRRNMIKSVALGLAEIERMDRAERSAGDKREGV